MYLGRCPVCHAHISLEAMVQDEAGRELLGLLAGLDSVIGRALVSYLGVFRAENRDLSSARALRLAREALALCSDYLRLAQAMAETCEALAAKGEVKGMRNHNYLKRVLETMPGAVLAMSVVGKPAPTLIHAVPSKTAQAIAAMMGAAHAE